MFMRTRKVQIGDRIKQLRKQKGFTQDQVAEAAGIDPKSLSRIECNRFKPSLDTLESLALAMDAPIVEFFANDGETPAALRAYLFETIAKASDRQLPELANVIRKYVAKRARE
jgi:transcriptional regulator with XRE-family HTH domain